MKITGHMSFCFAKTTINLLLILTRITGHWIVGLRCNFPSALVYTKSQNGKINLQYFITNDPLVICSSRESTTDTPILVFWWCLLWVSKPEWAALFTPERHMRCTWNSPLVKHLVISWQPAWQLSCSHLHTCEQALAGVTTRICHATASQCETRQMLSMPASSVQDSTANIQFHDWKN